MTVPAGSRFLPMLARGYLEPVRLGVIEALLSHYRASIPLLDSRNKCTTPP
jgi:hypothetical protein